MGFVAPSEQSVGTKPVAPKTPSQPVNNSKGKVLAISAKRTQPKNEESSGIPISGVVENAILDVDQTSKIAIVGRNGCGKR